MPEYTMQEFTLDIPEGLKDRTMNLFTLNDTGPSAFTFVVSRALAEPGDTLEVFADRLLKEMRKTFPKFELKDRQLIQIDQQPACALSYTWQSDDTLLHQRQALVLIDTDEAPDTRQAVGFIGTCPRAFSAAWAQQYDEIIASIRLRRAVPPQPPPPFTAQPVGATSHGPFFMYSAHDGKLNQFPHAHSLYEFCARNAISIEAFLFYGPAGQPLAMAEPPPRTVDGWVHPRTGQAFLLWTTDPAGVPTLLALLPSVRHLVGLANLRSVDCIADYLRALEK